MGLIEGNEIHSNALAGVCITTGTVSVPKWMTKNTNTHDHKNLLPVYFSGIKFYIIWLYFTILYNYTGVCLLLFFFYHAGSQPVLRHNRIHSGKQVGIYFYDSGGGVLEENDIYNHSFSGIQIRWLLMWYDDNYYCIIIIILSSVHWMDAWIYYMKPAVFRL